MEERVVLQLDKKMVTKNLPITHKIAEHQDEYITLPANIHPKGIVCFAFKLNFKDLIKLIFNRKIYIQLLTFGNPMQPIHINVDENQFELNRQYTIDEIFMEENK